MITKRRIDADPGINPFPIIVTEENGEVVWMRHASAPNLSALGGSIRYEEIPALIDKAARVRVALERASIPKRAKRRARGRNYSVASTRLSRYSS
jgi:hypothetical protein